MKASELRVGNLIRFNNLIQPEETVTVTPRFFCSAMSNEDFEINNYYNPINLTEEWLLKFGFEKRGDTGQYFIGDQTVSINDNGYMFWLGDSSYGKIIKYVHQFQNLYFLLTGKELSL